MARREFVIAQLSDLHCGSPYFDGDLLSTAVNETLAVDPDLVVIGGDLTAEGYAHEFRMAQEHLQPLFDRGLNDLVVPGERLAGVLDRERMALTTSPDLAGMFIKSSWRP